ncbi:hypothetical protein A3F37_02200 [Candidatus Saccharibacteria bacterium RIFCSPHIGHO2_12_FULL_41_12]|nr:MAG: hypothetical protein A3F37_02200 [Candidatus Saccharibacteria bacterium RIFCSPHIGHO2_12_FULL_41_12]
MFGSEEEITSPPVRLDTKVSDELENRSRSYANKLIKLGNVKVNGHVVVKPSYMVSDNDNLEITDLAEPSDMPTYNPGIIYEDDSCIVIDKPIGMLTHSKGAFYPEQTIASFIKPKISDRFTDTNRGGIVHRLDRATSGVILCAKTPEAEKWYKAQFADRKVKKTYIAVVSGSLEHNKAVIDLPIERNPKKPQFFRVGPHGKPSMTEYEVINETQIKSKTYSTIKLTPTTGRTHQLRVHLAELGNPILGDTFYEGSKHERLMLHASELEISSYISHEKQKYSAKLPDAFGVYVC